MGFIKEFKEFAIKGNVVDLAIAVIIGAAFGRIITALTESLLMPFVSLIMGKGGVSDVKFIVGETVFPIGLFLQAVIDFILVALVLFLVIKAMNRMNRKKEDAVTPAEPPQYTLTEKLLMEIRDGMKR